MIREQNIHKLLGFRTIVEYAEEVAGFRPNQTRTFLSLAQSLPEHEMVQQALSRGDTTLGKARIIVNNSPPEEQAQALGKALGATEKSLRESLQRRKTSSSGPEEKGSRVPVSPKVHAGKTARPAGSHYHHVTLKFTAEELARRASLMDWNREGKSREERVLEGLARRTGGQGNGAPYLVVLLTCPTCGKTGIPTNRGEVPAGQSVIAASAIAANRPAVSAPNSWRFTTGCPSLMGVARSWKTSWSSVGNAIRKHTRLRIPPGLLYAWLPMARDTF